MQDVSPVKPLTTPTAVLEREVADSAPSPAAAGPGYSPEMPLLKLPGSLSLLSLHTGAGSTSSHILKPPKMTEESPNIPTAWQHKAAVPLPTHSFPSLPQP